MISHEPSGYSCPFCRLVCGEVDAINDTRFVVYEDDLTLAFVAPKWWANNAGHVLVIPRVHYENLYTIPDDVLARVYVVSKRVAIAMRHAYSCEGTSTRQHNEPAGNQDVWHFHVHVFPRYCKDELYTNHSDVRWVTADERLAYVEKLKSHIAMS